jgi:hypothetical protein
MPDLTSKTLFSGEANINADDLGLSEVINFNTSVDDRLRENFKWKGKAIGVIGLTLSPDNTKVISGNFVTRGTTSLKEQRFPCNQIWENSSADVTLVVNFLTLDIFKFSEGGLWSDIVPASSIVHSFHDRENSVVFADERARLNITDFSARLICQLSSISDGRRGIIIKYVIVLFPASADDLADNADSRFASFPGIKAGEGAFPLGPKPSTPWRCPVVPFVRPGVPYESLPAAPSSRRLREAITAIMRKAAQPTTLDNGGNVQARWERIRSNPLELAHRAPSTSWPVAPAAASTESDGKEELLERT